MKNKTNRWMVLMLHGAVLAGFSLLQGCTTGNAPVSWLNWPYGTSSTRDDEPVVFPADSYSDPLMQPEPVVMPPEPVVTEPPAYTAAPDPEESTDYTVKKGDTLSAIASRYGTSWKKLAAFNNLSNPNRLVVGQEIRIPGSLDAPEPSQPRSAPSASSSDRSSIRPGSSYVIQRGDTLSTIASRSGVSVAELQAANGLSGTRIIAGKSLTIPKDGEVRTASDPAESKPAASDAEDPSPAPVADLEPVPAPVADAAPVASASSAPVYEHVLYPGETLDDVARQYGSSKAEIMSLNDIADEQNLKPGTKLLVPIPE
jgi:LysM repeat protein